VFNRNPTGELPIGQQEWQFLSTVGFSWNPTGGAISQQKFGQVYTHRPFGMTIRPDGKRALVSYYQTGNFGVLDLDTQALFRETPPSIPNPNDIFVDPENPPPPGVFLGLVAVTTALKLDNNLWPGRGVLKAQDAADPARLTLLPSPDEALLYAWDIAYAQNGRFAVGSHVGAGPPKTVSVLLPDFINRISRRSGTSPGARLYLHGEQRRLHPTGSAGRAYQRRTASRFPTRRRGAQYH
jgi:hypothetical protein